MLKSRVESVEDLEASLSEPSEADRAFVRELNGDIILLGAGGKMGPSLAKLAKRASDEAGVRKRVLAVSRFTSEATRRDLDAAGVITLECNLLNPPEMNQLPECENVLYLAGRKFGSTGRPDLTWAMNAIAPALAAYHYRRSRIVVFSTGNVYGLSDIVSGGSRETDPPSPTAEYAQSCLARERIFEYYSNEYKTECLIFRLNYAVDLRYGVLVDIAQKVYSDEPVDVTVPTFNAIWQRDANSYALRALGFCSSPPRILNVTGAETIRVREIAQSFATHFNRACRIQGQEGDRALLSDASLCHSLLGTPSVSLPVLTKWVGDWVMYGGGTLNKPTHFEVVDGNY
ncbi:MAG: NAD-dependent epimerase/dehydratase family protein [Acidobacteriaceae bacterium]|nr:NAD-dependent epimerase/dehydratase family protein [Acidobacteriaceae bacterium]MBV9502818.1 NAD-dependent epimerase/dehydratase family protein [Acidobacteriaceae bacterium]